MADIFIRCPSIGCRLLLTVPATSRGMLVTCKFCKRTIRIPLEKRDARPAATQPGHAAPPQRAGN
jgi:hypothetical protein